VKPRTLLSVVTLAALVLAGAACSDPSKNSADSAGATSTTVYDGVESTSTTGTPAVTIPTPQTPVAFGDPAADRAPVPGAIASPGPTVAQLCSGGYVKKATPPPSVTDPIKAAQLAAGNYTDRDPAHYVEDQLVPIELGGAPTDQRNLWPQTTAMAAVKERDERHTHTEVCAGHMTLAAAQAQMVASWGPLPKH
jgi:hypothetical protein